MLEHYCLSNMKQINFTLDLYELMEKTKVNIHNQIILFLLRTCMDYHFQKYLSSMNY